MSVHPILSYILSSNPLICEDMVPSGRTIPSKHSRCEDSSSREQSWCCSLRAVPRLHVVHRDKCRSGSPLWVFSLWDKHPSGFLLSFRVAHKGKPRWVQPAAHCVRTGVLKGWDTYPSGFLSYLGYVLYTGGCAGADSLPRLHNGT